MNILLCSHAAWRHTGYGSPVLPWVREMNRRGHSVAVLAVEERGPGLMEYRGLTHYLPAVSRFGEDVVRAVADHWQADVVVSLLDVWPLEPQGYAAGGRPWIAWCPIDQDPPQRGVVERLKKAALALSFSEWGAGVLRTAAPDLRAGAMPLGVDLGVFKPDPDARADLCQALALPEDAFLAGMVGSNLPGDRKALAQNIRGFCDFAKSSPQAYLVLWTTLLGGVNIAALLDWIGPPARQVRVVSQWELAYGGRHASLARFYAGLDVLLHASAAEGFGLPIIEAMACGTPVIGTDNTSMPELIPERAGWRARMIIPEWTRLDGWWYRPSAPGIEAALIQAQSDIQSTGTRQPYRDDCRGWARAFDWEIVGERWDETLKEVLS